MIHELEFIITCLPSSEYKETLPVQVKLSIWLQSQRYGNPGGCSEQFISSLKSLQSRFPSHLEMFLILSPDAVQLNAHFPTLSSL